MDQNKYLEDISEIKNIMNRSSRFISLSGLSGILAGGFALIGAYMAYLIVYKNTGTAMASEVVVLNYEQLSQLMAVGLGVMALALCGGILLSVSKANKNGEKVWDASSRRLIINFLIPLATGAVFCLMLIKMQLVMLIAPLTLIFYGLACLNASKYTIGGVRYLGLTIILLGLLATFFIGYGLLFWALGFGVCHILYGSLMYFKYEE